ncbi:clostripain-related cysteine peptidase [Lachnospiraceae bacterium C1.1]|nr:clostripain-related cysteine peptidase [Lachnospiraceae bacterium C1.1]
MKRRWLISYALAVVMSITMTGCGMAQAVVAAGTYALAAKAGSDGTYDTEDDSEGKIPHESSGEAEETLMVYMVGSNLESQMGAATQDMQEMALSGYDPEKMNIVVCAGGAKKWWNSSVKKKELSAYIMQDEDIVPFYEMEGTNMSEPETLTEFINAAKDSYPAEKYSLILWNHGGGVVVGYGADENYGNEMLSVKQLSSAIEDSDVCKEGKFEWIGFDACMMGMVEVADALKDDAAYMIASEEVEAQDGWNYKALGD